MIFGDMEFTTTSNGLILPKKEIIEEFAYYLEDGSKYDKNGFYIGNDNEIVEEAYYGKKKELIECEELFHEMIPAYQGSLNKVDLRLRDKCVEGITQRMEKIFKIKKLYLTIIDDFTNIANTVPYSTGCFKRDKETKFSDLTKTNVHVNMGMQFLVTGKFSPAEQVAILIHEIGHSLDSSILHFLASFPLGRTKTNWLEYIKYPEAKFDGTISELGNWLTAITTKFPPVHNFVVKAIAWTRDKIQKLFNFGFIKFINRVVNSLLEVGGIAQLLIVFSKMIGGGLHIKKLLMNSFTNPRNILGYGSETFADSVATAYGYGPELATALTKLTYGPNMHYGIRLQQGAQGGNIVTKVVGNTVGILYSNLHYLYNEVLGMYLKPHPSTAVRIMNQLRKCKRELKNPDITPEIRNQLQIDIQTLEEYIDSEVVSFKKNMQEGRVIPYITNAFIIKVCKGWIDIRQALNLLIKREA